MNKKNDYLLPFQYPLKDALHIYRKRLEFTLTIFGLFLIWYSAFVVFYYLFLK